MQPCWADKTYFKNNPNQAISRDLETWGCRTILINVPTIHCMHSRPILYSMFTGEKQLLILRKAPIFRIKFCAIFKTSHLWVKDHSVQSEMFVCLDSYCSSAWTRYGRTLPVWLEFFSSKSSRWRQGKTRKRTAVGESLRNVYMDQIFSLMWQEWNHIRK